MLPALSTLRGGATGNEVHVMERQCCVGEYAPLKKLWLRGGVKYLSRQPPRINSQIRVRRALLP